MKQRCTNPKHDAYADYGGRGITVCERWAKSFSAFVDDVGPRPAGTTLDRRDNSKGYEPGNVRWATSAEQNRNNRGNRLEAHEPAQIRWMVGDCGYRQSDVARFFGVSPATVCEIMSGKLWA